MNLTKIKCKILMSLLALTFLSCHDETSDLDLQSSRESTIQKINKLAEELGVNLVVSDTIKEENSISFSDYDSLRSFIEQTQMESLISNEIRKKHK